MSAFKRLVGKLERKGMSAKEAGGIAYNAGKAKYGKKGMTQKAEAGRHDESLVVEAKSWDSMSDAAKDLVLHSDSMDGKDHNLAHNKSAILSNLKKKADKAIYDPEKAKDMWKYHADNAAMSCCKTHGSAGDVWHKKFPASARKEAAAHWESLHRDHLHENLNEDVQQMDDDERKEIFSMLQAAIDDKPATFAEHFANAIQPKLADTIEAMKAEIKQFMFKHINGGNVNENERSRNLLSNKASKSAGWKGGKNPTDSMDLSTVAADFSPNGEVGTQHEAVK